MQSMRRDSSVGIATTLRAGLSWNRIQVGAIFSASVQIGPGAHPASYTLVSFSGEKVAGAWHKPPAAPRAEVKERLEPNLYSPSTPSWPVPGRSLPVAFIRLYAKHQIMWWYLWIEVLLNRTTILLTWRHSLSLNWIVDRRILRGEGLAN
jgi:hypothetical protein